MTSAVAEARTSPVAVRPLVFTWRQNQLAAWVCATSELSICPPRLARWLGRGREPLDPADTGRCHCRA